MKPASLALVSRVARMATVFIGTGNTQYLAGRLEENAVFFENNCQTG
jgi:hypothetical protein